MSKIRNPEVEIVLDRPRLWRLDWNTIAELQELGYDYMDPQFVASLRSEKDPEGNAVPKRNQLKFIRALIWAGLVWEDPGLTITQVGAMLPLFGGGIEYLSQKISQAWEAASPPAEPSSEAVSDPLAETPAPAASAV